MWGATRDQALPTMARERGQTLTNVAVAWGLHRHAVNGAIIRKYSEREAQEMVTSLDWQLSGQEVAAVERALAPWD